MNVDRPWTEVARQLGEIMAEHHVVQAAQQRGVVFEVRRTRELLDVVHGVAITDDLGPGAPVGVERFLLVNGCERIVKGDFVAFDSVRAADGSRLKVAAKVSGPAPGLAQCGPQTAPIVGEFVQDGLVAVAQSWGLKQHDTSVKMKRLFVNLFHKGVPARRLGPRASSTSSPGSP